MDEPSSDLRNSPYYNVSDARKPLQNKQLYLGQPIENTAAFPVDSENSCGRSYAIDTEPKSSPVAPTPYSYRTRKRHSWLPWFVVLVIILLCAAGLYLVLGPKKAAGGRQTAPVTIVTTTAKKGNIGVYLDAIGTVTPIYTASITSQVTGVVTNVAFTEGQSVNKGDPLVDIDSRQYEATLEQAQGTLERDENVLAQAQMDLTRYQDAWSRNAVAKQTLDDQQKIVAQDQGTVRFDQGVVQYDQVQVDYCHITAPFAGIVGLRLVDPGNLVTGGAGGSSSSNPLLVLLQRQPITVVFTIPEDSLSPVEAQLRKGATLSVEAYDRSGQTKLAEGQVLALDNQIDTTTGTVKVRAIFKNDDFALFPNQFVNTRLLVQELEGVTLIPTATIQQDGQTSFVYVVTDGVVHVRDLTPGVSDNGQTQVQGINPGDVVANSSFDKLQDNDKVTIATAGGTAGAHAGASPHAGGSPHAGHSPHGSHSPDAAASAD